MVLLSHRVLEAAPFGVAVETHAALHPRFRVSWVKNRRVVAEDKLILKAFERGGGVGRPVVTVVLRGTARVTAHGRERWLRRGDVSVVDRKGEIRLRSEGDCYESLVVEWDPGSLSDWRPAGFDTVRLAPQDVERLTALSAGFASDDEATVQGALAASLALLDGAGLSFARFDERIPAEGVPAADRALSRMLDRALSRLADRPALVDVVDGLSISGRQLSREVPSFNRRYGFNATTWREALKLRRVSVGAALMSLAEATTERVSALLGYSSPTAFCRAFAEVGLPAPGRISAAVAELA